MSTLLGLSLIGLLSVCVLPVPRVRRLLFLGTTRLGQAILLALLGACGTFFVEPDAAPDWLVAAARPVLDGVFGTLPNLAAHLNWLLLAVLAVAVSLPPLLLLELASSLSSATVLVHGLRKEIRQAAAWVDNRLAALGASGLPYTGLPSEISAASEALRTSSSRDNHKPVPLVLDLLK